MGVSVESTDVLLTWDEFASRSWENEADTWDNPHFVAFTVSSSENAPAFAEVGVAAAAFFRDISEGLGFAEIRSCDVTISPFMRGLGFAEVYDRQAAFNMGISEGLGFAEIRSCDVTISPFMRGLGFAELIEKGPNKIIPEGLGFAENYTRQSVFDKDIAVSLSFGENPAKSASVFLTEAFRLSDYMLLPFCTGILSDIALLSAPVSESEIADMAGQSYPHGFSAWRRFDDGEFEFRKALVKLIMESEDAEGAYDSKVTDHKVVSDVFDIMESGVLTITRASHRVTFKKRFHRIPVISVTSLNTTAFAIPEVQEVTRTYFDIRLRVANGDSASGNISWRASGY